MQSRQPVISTALIMAIMLMLVITAAPAAELPEGVTLKVLDEFPSEIRGMEKIQLQELRLEPGAKWENHIPADLVVRRFRRLLIASRSQDLQVEHPI